MYVNRFDCVHYKQLLKWPLLSSFKGLTTLAQWELKEESATHSI